MNGIVNMKSEVYKWLLVTLLCAISALLTYYFHGVLKVSTVFTHFFYIPIILSAIWWKRYLNRNTPTLSGCAVRSGLPEGKCPLLMN